MCANPVTSQKFRQRCLLNSEAGQDRSWAQDSGAQLVWYIAPHPLRKVIIFPSVIMVTGCWMTARALFLSKIERRKVGQVSH